MFRHMLAVAALTALISAATPVVALDRGLVFVATTAVAQSSSSDVSSRDQMNDFLSRARQAMAEGNLETADSLISRAEGLNVAIGMFHMGDSPAKARRDWKRLREARSAQPATDPFAAQAAAGAAAPAPAAATVTASPPMPTTPANFASNPPPASFAPAATPYPTTAASPDTATPFSKPLITAPPTDDRVGYLTAPASSVAGAPAGFNPGPATPLPQPAMNPDIQLLGAVEPVGAAPPQNVGGPSVADAKPRCLELVRRAREALAAGNVREAEALAGQADALGVPDGEFGQQDDRPWLVLLEIQKLRRRDNNVVPAAAGASPPAPFPGVQAIYDPAKDTTQNIPASTGGIPAPPQPQRGDAVPAAAAEPIGPGAPSGNELLNQTAQSQDLLARQITSEVSRLETQAKQFQGTDPAQSRALLQQARVMVEKSTVNTQSKQILLRRLDRDLGNLDEFVEANLPKIELAQRNREVKDQMSREQQATIEMQERLAKLIDEYNMLVDQQRFPEAEVLAKRASEFAPNEPIVAQLQNQSKALRRMFNNGEIRAMKEAGAQGSFASVEEASAPFDDRLPIRFPKNWQELKARRLPFLTDAARRSPKELEIEQKLRTTPVSLKFDKMTLSQAFEKLSAMTGVPIYLDQRGLAAEGVDSSMPISIDLSTEISLKSALNIMLNEHHLTYVVKDEVLKITSDRMRMEDVYTVTYPVGDLVIPIPNFSPSNRMGLTGALADAQAALMNNGGGMGLASHAPISVMASNNVGEMNASVLGQVPVPFATGGGGGATGTPQNIPFGPGAGPGGMGGGVKPDFDSLIELITSTIRQQDWQDNGGTIGFIKSHDTTLSLVITHDVRGHEEIENLLTQLRKLQDLQVTIEVRFITLNDAFYEQVGVDFDMKINDNIDKKFQIFGRPADQSTAFSPGPLTVGTGDPPRDVQDRDLHGNQSVTVGMSAPGVFSSDLDIPFTQTSLQQVGGAIITGAPSAALAGGLAQGGMQTGFAILSDLEAYFFINAVQDDQRSNILQAPKVTMFNGQQAFVSDTQQVPFVVSVIPVVGSFAAAQQPVIVVLNEGTSLSVQAVVSNDRRFVRMTMVPFFSQIGDVNTFTFEGSQSSTSSSSSATQGPGEESKDDTTTSTKSGTTVQLPTFAFQTVTTTVSVPDGGTVLLGGIKRMREARFEDGVPLLSKLPYVNRLFQNVAIGKSSSSLMMMVTPRIIIQEEEEAAIGIAQNAP